MRVIPVSSLFKAIVCAALLLPMWAHAEQGVLPQEWSYKVSLGDTLIDVGRQFLNDPDAWPQVQKLNHIADPRRLVPGSFIRIPLELLNQKATVAEVVFVQGHAKVKHTVRAEFEAAVVGAQISAGDVLQTAVDSSLTLRFSDGSRLLLVPSSEVSVVHLLAVGRAGVPSVRMRLQEGATELRVSPAPSAKRSFEVQTPAVNLGVRGTDFRARVEGAKKQAWLEVLEGRVAAQASGSAALVSAGQGLMAEENKPLQPIKPLLAAPDFSATSARIERVPIRLNWTPLAGASSYRAQIFAPDKLDSLLLEGTFTQPSAKWADLPDGRYVLRVRAVDVNALEGRNADHAFVLKARPEPPFTTSPTPAASVYGEVAALGWTSSAAAERYRVQVANADDRDFKASVVDTASVTQARYDAALAPGEYQWRVASVAKDNDQGPFGDAQKFTLKPMPNSPQLGQAQASKEAIVVRWDAPPNGAKVRYQISQKRDFSKALVDAVTDGPEGRLDKPGGGTFYIRAKTIDADGFEGNFGGSQQVHIERSTWWMLVPPLLTIFIL
jgi:hypothetical protein